MSVSDLWYQIDAAIIVLSFLMVLLIVAEIGYRAGKKRQAQATIDQSNLVQQGLLTLLSLLLAFGVSMAEMRYEERNSILIEESTSIGTTYLRASLFSKEFEIKFTTLLKQYLDTRIEWYQFKPERARVALIEQKTVGLQNSLWSEAATLGRDRPTVTASLLLASLNQTIDIESKQKFAYSRLVPRSIIYLLYLVSVMVVGLVGFSNGLTGSHHVVYTTMMSAVLAMTLFVILDLSRAERGLIRIKPQVLIDLRRSLEGR